MRRAIGALAALLTLGLCGGAAAQDAVPEEGQDPQAYLALGFEPPLGLDDLAGALEYEPGGRFGSTLPARPPGAALGARSRSLRTVTRCSIAGAP